MISVDNFSAELYRNYDWRFDEVRRLLNVVRDQKTEDLQDELRKSLVLVLYAHFEGFCIFALEHYLTAINGAEVACNDAVPALVAGAWEKLFNVMQHGDAKCEVFKQMLPQDEGLHRHWRRRHFVEEIERLMQFRVKIPEDVINSESNLKPAVLARNLFILGLDHTFAKPHEETLHNLLKRRNNIAHGDQRRGVKESEYDGFEGAVFDICYQLIDFLVASYSSQAFRRPQLEYAL